MNFSDSSFSRTIHQMTECEVLSEFEGISHKTSHDGVFTMETRKLDPAILQAVAKIKVTVGGSYILKD